MLDFLHQNASAVFALLGAVGGAVLSFLSAWLITKRDYNLRLWDKLLDRRIQAHEAIIEMAMEMRLMVGLGGADEHGEVLRAPRILISRQVFEEWFTRFTLLTQEKSTWLSTTAKRELNFAQDYLVNLHMYLGEAPDENYLKIGRIVRLDFIDISSQLEKKAFQFFQKDIRRLRLNDLNDWHKFPLEKTQERLTKTNLLTRREEVLQLATSTGTQEKK